MRKRFPVPRVHGPVHAFIALGLALTSAWVHGQSSSAIEQEFKALKALRDMPAPANLPPLSDGASDWFAVRNAELHDRGLAFRT